MYKPCHADAHEEICDNCGGDTGWRTCIAGKLHPKETVKIAKARKIREAVCAYLEKILKKNKALHGTQYSVGQITRIIKKHL